MKKIKKIKNYLGNKYNFRYNEVSLKIEYKQLSEIVFKPLDNRKLKSIFIELNEYGIMVAETNLESLLKSDFADVYNPFETYFQNLPIVNGNENIKALAKTVKTHNDELFECFLEKWLIGWVACMLEKDSTNQQCIILSGNQGLGKSTWVNFLMPKELKPYYYAGKIGLKDKDTLGLISSKCLINLDELVNLSGKDIGSLKELITKGTIDFRRVHEKLNEEFSRRASFVGSINDAEFLHDLTGNRRFLSFETSEFENKGRHSVDMNLVLAEAYQLYNSGVPFWFNEEEQEKIEENNKRFLIVPPEEEKLLERYSPIPLTAEQVVLIKLNRPRPKRADFESKSEFIRARDEYEFWYKSIETPKHLTATEIYSKIVNDSRVRKYDVSQFGKILQKNKFKRVKCPYRDRYVYVVYKL